MTQTTPNTPSKPTFAKHVQPGDAVVHVETGAIGEVIAPTDDFVASLMLRGVAPRDQVLILWEDAERPEFWAWERRTDVRR